MPALAHEVAHDVTHHTAAGMPRNIHDPIAESEASIVCSQCGVDCSLRSAAYVAHLIDDPAAFRAGMVIIHDAAASLIDAVAPVLIASASFELAA